MLIDGAGVLLPFAKDGYRVFNLVALARFDRLLLVEASHKEYEPNLPPGVSIEAYQVPNTTVDISAASNWKLKLVNK